MALEYEEPGAAAPGNTLKPVATDTVVGEDVQLFKPVFGGPAEAKRVAEDVPLPARDYHGGSLRFDTGLVILPAGAPVLVTTAGTKWVDAILLTNLTTEVHRVTLTDGADISYGGQDLQPSEFRLLPMFGFGFIGGLKMAADVEGVIGVQIKGTR